MERVTSVPARARLSSCVDSIIIYPPCFTLRPNKSNDNDDDDDNSNNGDHRHDNFLFEKMREKNLKISMEIFFLNLHNISQNSWHMMRTWLYASKLANNISFIIRWMKRREMKK